MRSIILILVTILVSGQCLLSEENQFPDDKVANVVELYPNSFTTFNDYIQANLHNLNRQIEWWSTLHPLKNLDKFYINITASSVLGDSYKSANLCDGKAETAWVPKVKGGIGEWAKITIIAESQQSEYTSTPFSLFEVAILTGYAKSPKTWLENNRVKKMLVVAHSPKLAQNEWVAYRLNLKDEQFLQIFKIPSKHVGYSILEMQKEIWIKIEDIYKGTKYNDTCISEFVAVGSFTS